MGTDVDIVTRAEWGAKRPKSRRLIRVPVKNLWLHHTAGSERGAAGMRAIQNFHQAPKPHGREWVDIAYSWVYCPYERKFFEGRGPGVAGAHTQGHNSTSHALCIMGNFDRDPVPDTLIADVAGFVRWHAEHGPDRITGGHRDVSPTSCPGNNLYRRIGDINTVAANTTRFVPAPQDEDDDMFITTADTNIVWFLTGGVRVKLAPAREADEIDSEWRTKLRVLSKGHPLLDLPEA